MTGARSEVYYLQFHDADGDDHRGANYGFADDHGVWLSRDAAQAEADRRNAHLCTEQAARSARRYAGARRQYEQARAEHETLVASGLRTGEFTGRAPADPGATTPDTLRNYWLVGTFELNDAPAR